MKWKLVPVEPTEAMWRAANRVVPANPRKEWEAMLAAAPSATDDEELVERVALGIRHAEEWSEFWSPDDARKLARAAIKAMEEG